MDVTQNEPISLLEDIHKHFLNSVRTFRYMVCESCDWSEPTFYRKLASKKKDAMSEAERKIVIEMAEFLISRISDCVNTYKVK